MSYYVKLTALLAKTISRTHRSFSFAGISSLVWDVIFNFSVIQPYNILRLKIKLGNYPEKCLVRIWKRYIPLLIDLLISNNFSSMTFFCATRILRVIGRQSIVYNHS